MIIHDSDRLQEGIRDHRADEPDPALFHVLAHGNGDFRDGWNVLHRLPATVDLPAVRKAPQIGVKRAELFLDLLYNLRIFSDAVDLVLIPDDSSIRAQRLQFLVSHRRALIDDKTVKRSQVCCSLMHDDLPGETDARPFQAKHLELEVIVMTDLAPFMIMIVFYAIVSLQISFQTTRFTAIPLKKENSITKSM